VCSRWLADAVEETPDDIRTRRALDHKPCLRGFAETLIAALHSDESISAAILKAHPGDRIDVMPGVYHEGPTRLRRQGYIRQS
jgi:hypothetical protein